MMKHYCGNLEIFPICAKAAFDAAKFSEFFFRTITGRRCFTTVLPLLQKLARKIRGKCRLGVRLETRQNICTCCNLNYGYFFSRGGEVLKFCNPI